MHAYILYECLHMHIFLLIYILKRVFQFQSSINPSYNTDFIRTRGGVSLRPGDGIIHSWLNRMLLPDTVGTGGDSHTRFPIGISFPAGSGLVAFAAATGVMPLDMPESVLVRFTGTMQPGITLRDLVHAIPYYALKAGLLTLEKKTKKNVFSGRILEIEGLPNLTCEQAFELSDASAERSAGGCTIKLNKEPIIEYMTSNITLLRWMISEVYTYILEACFVYIDCYCPYMIINYSNNITIIIDICTYNFSAGLYGNIQRIDFVTPLKLTSSSYRVTVM